MLTEGSLNMQKFKSIARINTKKTLLNYRTFLDTNDIESAIFYGNDNVEEIWMSVVLGVSVYTTKDNIFKHIFPKMAKKVKLISDLKGKVDMLFLSRDRGIYHLDMEEERAKLKKRALLVYKSYNSKSSYRVVQQIFEGLMIDSIINGDSLTRIFTGKKGSIYTCLENDDKLNETAIKEFLKNNGFEKLHVLAENIKNSYEDSVHNFCYRVYEKGSVVSNSFDEEALPLMTSDEISDRFNDMMDKNELSSEDLEL